jgi:hypothetical protein
MTSATVPEVDDAVDARAMWQAIHARHLRLREAIMADARSPQRDGSLVQAGRTTCTMACS